MKRAIAQLHIAYNVTVRRRTNFQQSGMIFHWHMAI